MGFTSWPWMWSSSKILPLGDASSRITGELACAAVIMTRLYKVYLKITMIEKSWVLLSNNSNWLYKPDGSAISEN